MATLFVTFLLATGAFAQKVVDLSGSSWTLQNLPLNISVPASLPSQAHLDLLENNIIGDPLYGLNDFSLRWIAWANWTYVSDPLSLGQNAEKTWLVFNGLDTFATISLCGQFVAATNNQFRQYHFDVTDVVQNCSAADTVLRLEFASAPSMADQIASQPDQEAWPSSVEITFEFTNRQFIRKEQSDFGWDWGPAFAPAGPWQPAYVVQLNQSDVYVRNSLVDIYRQGQQNNRIPDQSAPWVLNASLDIVGDLPPNTSLQYVLQGGPANETVSSGSLQNITTVNGAITGATTVPDGSVDLWWPAGLGNQTLYFVTVSALAGNETLASSTKRVGFRTIVLNALPVTSDLMAAGVAPGNNWHFEVNGNPFYAKGSNFIPPDAFWPRVTPARIQTLFDSVVDGNQNMLRVWSSGAYSPDFLYDIADEMGILLWCEFQFSDALYPVSPDFLDNVYDEAVYQVRRVNHHASMAFWAGGNEFEDYILPLDYSVAPGNYSYYYQQYESLFLTTLFPAVFENSRSISYMPSSTSNGFMSLNFTQAPYFEERLEDVVDGSVYGDTDYYDYDSTAAFNYHVFPVGRFANEFGFHSMPSLQTWQQVLPENQLSFNSSFIAARNHHNPAESLEMFNHTLSMQGMGQMTQAIQNWYPVPDKTDPVANFSAWCLSTQIFQADFYTYQISWYRRGSGMPQRTLGSLYWQLEDLWQAPTWAGIEYDGRWKVLHYRAKDIYQNVVISPFYNYTTHLLEVWVSSDLWHTASGTVSAEWFTWDGEPLANLTGLSKASVTVGALNSTSVYSQDIAPLLSAQGLDFADVVMRWTVDATGRTPNNDTVRSFSHAKWFHAAPLGQANLVDPGLLVAHDDADGTFTVEATKGVSAWTWLDYPAGQVVVFDDNGFWLGKGEKKVIGYQVKSASSTTGWQQQVTVQNIWNNTLSL